MQIGDEMLIRLQDGIDPKIFGSGWRIGTIVALGLDLLADEPVIELDDAGPRIYAAQISFASVLTPASRVIGNGDGI